LQTIGSELVLSKAPAFYEKLKKKTSLLHPSSNNGGGVSQLVERRASNRKVAKP